MWDWAIWGALIIGAGATAAAAAYVTVGALRAWRDVKRARRHLFREVDRLTERGLAVADNAARAADMTEAVERVARLRRSLARLAVLREAVDEVQDMFGRLTAVMPRR